MQEHEKIIIRYYSEDDKENINEEGMWATKVSNNLYRVDNIPFFARSLSLGDIVLIEKKGGRLYVKEVKQISGNSTVRIIFNDNDILRSIREELKKKDCSSEYDDIHQLIAINIPAKVDYFGDVKPYLEKGSNAGLWEYEESCLAHSKR